MAHVISCEETIEALRVLGIPTLGHWNGMSIPFSICDMVPASRAGVVGAVMGREIPCWSGYFWIIIRSRRREGAATLASSSVGTLEAMLLVHWSMQGFTLLDESKEIHPHKESQIIEICTPLACDRTKIWSVESARHAISSPFPGSCSWSRCYRHTMTTIKSNRKTPMGGHPEVARKSPRGANALDILMM